MKTLKFFCFLALILFPLPLSGQTQGDIDAMRARITDEASAELVNLDLGDSSVSLRIDGRWKGTLQGSLGFALTPFGTEALTGDAPLFAQEGDLTLSLWIRERWFVEASFVDDSALNTYRMGYQGKDGEPVRYVGLGNTGLDFPSFPYLDLGGDSPSSFGIYGHFGAGNLALHTLVRYDAAAREERVFIGNRERSFSYADLSRPQRGNSFVLPDENLDSVPDVYIQDIKGSFIDSEGRRWRLLEPSEYGASARFGLVELTLGNYTGGASEPEGMIAVAYNKGGSSPWRNSLGSYGKPDNNDGSGFLGNIQNYFNRTGFSIELAAYPQCGGATPVLPPLSPTDPLLPPVHGIPGESVITNTNTPILIIYEPGAFSPFERQNRYLGFTNTSSQAQLVKLSTGDAVSGYDVLLLEDNSLDFNFNQAPGRRDVYELIREGSRDRRSPEECWPLGDHYPGLYLPGRTVFNEDIGIRFTNYTSASSAFSIGTDVVPGSVQVFRNGVQDTRFVFNSHDGTVSLGDTVGFSEIIRITYLKQSSETRLGSFAAGIGSIWESEGPFSWKLGLGVRWNVSSDSYSETEATSPGTVGLGAEARWDFNRIKAGITLGLGYEQPDTTGLYRAAGMEGNEILLPLTPGNSFISEIPDSVKPLNLTDRADLVYRNYRESSILGGSSWADISSGASIISGQSGPYPAMDRALSAQVLVAEFEFSNGNAWTGFQTPLELNGEFLERAGKIEVWFRFLDFYGEDLLNDEITVSLQIGALADKDSGFPENPELQITIPLYKGNFSGDFYRIRKIEDYVLSDQDRSRLQGAKHLRLLIERTGGNGNLGGRVILAPPIVRGALWRPVTVKDREINPKTGFSGGSVNAYEDVDIRLQQSIHSNMIDRLHSGSSRQRVLEISWEGLNDSGAGADGRIPAVPLSNYRSLSFFIRRPAAVAINVQDQADKQEALDSSSLRFILANGPSLPKNSGEISLEAEIPLAAFKELGTGDWARVDISYQGASRYVRVEGASVPGSSVRYNAGNVSGMAQGITGEGISTYAAFLIIPMTGETLPDGNMAVDEIFLEDSIPSYRVNNGETFEWSQRGTILSLGNQALVSDMSFQVALETGAQGNPFEERANESFGMNGRSQAGISLLGLAMKGNYSYSINNSQGVPTNYTWSAGHGLFRSFGPFSFRDTFNDAPDDKNMNHTLTFTLGTRIRANLSGEANLDNDKLRRSWQAGTGGKPADKIPVSFSIDAAAAVNEKDEGPDLYNYAGSWAGSFAYLVPDSGHMADGRDMRGNFRLRLETSPLGAELFFQGNSAYTMSRNTYQAGSMARMDFPLNPASIDSSMLFRFEREYRRNVIVQRLNFQEDTDYWGGSFSDALPLVFSLPFYSLFASDMNDKMDEFSYVNYGGGAYADLSQFGDRFEYSLQRAMNYGLSSFIVPRRFSFRLSRVLEQKLDVSRDTLNLGAALNFSSINMFGAMGVSPVFSFYHGDEFAHSVETQFSFPKDESVSWGVRANQSMFFYGFRGAEMAISNTYTINSSSRAGEGNRWTDSLGFSWTIPREKTLLGSLYASFARMARDQNSWLTLANLAESEYELLIRETAEFIIEKIPNVIEDDYIRFSFVVGHESIVRIFGRLNLSVFAKLKISEDTGTSTFSFLGTIGTTLNLMF